MMRKQVSSMKKSVQTSVQLDHRSIPYLSEFDKQFNFSFLQLRRSKLNAEYENDFLWKQKAVSVRGNRPQTVRCVYFGNAFIPSLQRILYC